MQLGKAHIMYMPQLPEMAKDWMQAEMHVLLGYLEAGR